MMIKPEETCTSSQNVVFRDQYSHVQNGRESTQEKSRARNRRGFSIFTLCFPEVFSIASLSSPDSRSFLHAEAKLTSPRQRMRLGEESSVLGDTPQLYSTSFPRITPVFLNPFKSAPALFPPSGAGIAPLAAVPPPLLCPCIISSNYKLSPKLTAVSLNSSACLVLSLS